MRLQFYKHVVHDIEVFLWKAEVEHRLAGTRWKFMI